MRRTTLFALILLTAWSGRAAAGAVALSVAEERLKPGSPLWKPDGVRAHALATASGLYRPLGEGSRVRFVTQDTLQVGGAFDPRWDPLRGPRPTPSLLRVLSDSVATIFLESGAFVRTGRVSGSGEAIVGFVGIDSVYHAVPNGTVWLAQPRSLEFVSTAAGDSVASRRIVPQDSVVAVVMADPAPEANNSDLRGLVGLAAIVVMVAALIAWVSDPLGDSFTVGP